MSDSVFISKDQSYMLSDIDVNQPDIFFESVVTYLRDIINVLKRRMNT